MTTTSTRRVSEIIKDVKDGALELRPFFQRRLVWSTADKEKFIDTVLRGYPFPEVFVSTGELDLETSSRTNWLVDGQQRITTLRDYVFGDRELVFRNIPAFNKLERDQKVALLDYEVCVRDLGIVDEPTLREIFNRINSTDYALKSMEILNAMYSGEFITFCSELSQNDFFVKHGVFSKANRRRMYDITFCVILVATIMGGYYRRDERNEEFLERYNERFDEKAVIIEQLSAVFLFIEECEFGEYSRVWKQTDLFTLLVEIHSSLFQQKRKLDVSKSANSLRSFYDAVQALAENPSTTKSKKEPQIAKYLKAATKATNDKYARIDRAEIISHRLVE